MVVPVHETRERPREIKGDSDEARLHVSQEIDAARIVVVVRSMEFEMLDTGKSGKSISHVDGGEDLICVHKCESDRKSTRLNSSHSGESRMPSSA